jgi:hypothetical protein
MLQTTGCPTPLLIKNLNKGDCKPHSGAPLNECITICRTLTWCDIPPSVHDQYSGGELMINVVGGVSPSPFYFQRVMSAEHVTICDILAEDLKDERE